MHSGPDPRHGFPFAAVVGQEALKLCLFLNAVNPLIGGVLIRGRRGTAKSTVSRAFAEILPDIAVVSGCPYRCDPLDPASLCSDCEVKIADGTELPVERSSPRLTNLPLNTTEDRLVGSMDFEHALRTGERRFQPGLLAEANRGVLYIDEVNLLDDHLVDLLLDAASSGINVANREGVRFTHPSRFVIVASMNPDEGEIRPQLLDRFGLSVTVSTITNPESRVEIIKRRESYDADPPGFRERWRQRQEKIRAGVVSARRRLNEVTTDPSLIREISNVCSAHFVSGHRADILLHKAARALAALEGRRFVERSDVYTAARFVLHHRARSPGIRKSIPGHASPFDGAADDRRTAAAESPTVSVSPDGRKRGEQTDNSIREGSPTNATAAVPDDGSDISPSPTADGSANNPSSHRIFEVADPVRISANDVEFARESTRRHTGRRRTANSSFRKTGRYVRATTQRRNDDIALDATIRAAAPFQLVRPKSGMSIRIHEEDIREKVRKETASTLLVFVVDASGSMGTRLVRETKGAILALLLEAYQKRDRVSMVAFRGADATVVLPPTNSVDLASRQLERLPTGGKTPLGLGLLEALQLIRSELRRDPSVCPLMILVTDGKANVGVDPSKHYEGPAFKEIHREISFICERFRSEKSVRSIVVDTEIKNIGGLDLAASLASSLNARYYLLEDIVSRDILRAVDLESAASSGEGGSPKRTRAGRRSTRRF
jgi:magnesium chelatase subunit D